MSLEYVEQHQELALLKLVPALWGKPRIASWLRAYARQWQVLEDVLWELLGRSLDTSTGVHLDRLCELIGQARHGFSDADLRIVAKARAVANRSRGLGSDLSAALLALFGVGGSYGMLWVEGGVIYVVALVDWDATKLRMAAEVIPYARAAGVGVHFFSATDASAMALFGTSTYGGASAPPFQAVATGVGATGAASVPWPAHAAGDLGLLYVSTANELVATPAGWTPCGSAGVGTPGAATSVSMQVFYRVAATGAEPNATVADAGARQFCNILTYRQAGAYVEAFAAAASADSASTAASSPSVTTLGPNRTVVTLWCGGAAANNQFSGYSVPATSERYDVGAGAFIAMAVADGSQAVAGPTGAQSATIATSSRSAAVTLAIAPADPGVFADVRLL